MPTSGYYIKNDPIFEPSEKAKGRRNPERSNGRKSACSRTGSRSSKQSYHAYTSPEPVTVPPEPCLEPRPAVVGAFDSDTPKQQVPTAQSIPPHSSAVPPSLIAQQKSHPRPAVPSHIHGGLGAQKPFSQQTQFGRPAPRPRPGIQGIQKDGKKVTPEQAEEAKLRSKYGKLNKPGGSDFLRMRLNKGGQKYFDSGDYNVAMSKGKKLGLRQTPVATTKPGLPTPVEVTTGETIPTPASIHHRKQSTEISKLAV
ncbi:uncharacterized protein [Amphiura filiformis]|uniref:uncharacterized protein n=1 Tax=Amphiura filiformis TaxID=82378 RepID=UPI003B2114EA